MLPFVSLLLVSLSSLCNSLCETDPISGRFLTRQIITSENCVVFVDCVFDSLTESTVHGGAINVNNPNHEITIAGSLFHQCTARDSSVDVHGGAACLVGDPISIARCCSSMCGSRYGQAFFFDVASVSPTIDLSSFVYCMLENNTYALSGAVTCERNVRLDLASGNFTECHIGHGAGEAYGSAISLWSQTQGATHILYTLVTACGGGSSLNIDGVGTSSIQSCVFHDNRCRGCDIFIRTNELVTVENCHFLNNAENLPLYAYTSAKFIVRNCYFDIAALITSPAFYSLTTLNQFNVTEPKWTLTCYLETVYCPAPPLCHTERFTASSSFLLSLSGSFVQPSQYFTLYPHPYRVRRVFFSASLFLCAMLRR
jgi:hypothetical protein